MKREILGIGAVLMVFAVLSVFATTPTLAHVDVYFSPDPTTISLEPGENVTIQVIAGVDANETDGFRTYQVGIDFDPDIVNITKIENPCKVWIGPPHNVCLEHWWEPTFGYSRWDGGKYGQWVWITAMDDPGYDAPVTAPIANLTIEAISAGTSPLEFTHEVRWGSSGGDSELFDKQNDMIPPENITWIDSSITVTGPQETFSRELVEGWNLISLPLTADNMTVANIIDKSLSGKYDALYRYDAVNKSWVAMDSSDVMENGVGYFIHMTSAGTWTYQGSAYLSMSVPLEQGLNMIGWLNCSKDISNALSSIEGDYWYVARWNATAQKFEVYNPVAPPEFNDFTTMERGEGYFISMKSAGTLTESC